MNRRSLIALASVMTLATWYKPIINTVVTPTHAQTSCIMINDVDVVGDWRFTDQNNVTVDIEIIDDNTINFDDRSVNEELTRTADGILIFAIRNPAAPWQGSVTQEENCVASEITITRATTSADTYTAPLVGVKI